MEDRKIYGLPCVGGKSKLAPYLCEVIEQCAKNYGLSTYISACGGGGKDILSIRGQFFDKFIYNEFETPLAKLMEALTKFSNILPLVDEVDKIIESALQVDVNVDNAEEKQEIQLRAMFQYIYNLFADRNKKKIENMSLIELAACGVILVYGSVQNNRQSIHYKSSDGKRSFYNDMYVHSKYFSKLCEISEQAQGMEVINGDCFDIIEKYKNDENVFIYIDPPYWNCSNDYTNTFDFNDHIKLANLCRDAKCKIMISMHEFGIAPYFLRLNDEEGWYVYKTPEIPHSSRTGNSTTVAYAEMWLDRIRETGIKVNIGKEHLINNIIEEYIFTNFEVEHECFVKKYYAEPEINKNSDEEVFKTDTESILDFAICSLYMEKLVKRTQSKKIKGVDETICEEVVNDIFYVFQQGVSGEHLKSKNIEADDKNREMFKTYVRQLVTDFREYHKGAKDIKLGEEVVKKQVTKSKKSVKVLYPNAWNEALENMNNIFNTST